MMKELLLLRTNREIGILETVKVKTTRKLSVNFTDFVDLSLNGDPCQMSQIVFLL